MGIDAPRDPPAGQVSSVFLPVYFTRLNEVLKTYLKPEEIGHVERAFHFIAREHSTQTRKSGEPYVVHPVAVAEIVAGWRLDLQAIVAALLHDVVEDTKVTPEEVAVEFGDVASMLVDGLSKLDKMKFASKEEAQAESLQKMLMAMTGDVRVILIKLADRLHNMRTLGALKREQQVRISTETLEIYAPIAERLGLYQVFRELQDLSFRHRHPWRYQVLAKWSQQHPDDNREVIPRFIRNVEETLRQCEIEATVERRSRHVYSIYRRLRGARRFARSRANLQGVRLLVDSESDCYRALGAVHRAGKPMPGRFKDLIAIPKNNGYQSLHTVVIGPFGEPVEVQIRTHQMQRVAEVGIASRWLYGSAVDNSEELRSSTTQWLELISDLQSMCSGAQEFVQHLKDDLESRNVFVFSPQGKIYTLTKGSTAVDYAYAVHSDLGNRCIACKINDVSMPLSTGLKNGDRVHIVQASLPNPNPSWLSFVKTSRARSHIRAFLKTTENDEFIALGERLLGKALLPYGMTLSQVSVPAWDSYLASRSLASSQKVFSGLGRGEIEATRVAEELMSAQDRESGRPGVVKPRARSSLHISGAESQVVLASCCQPIPGDPIVGRMQPGRGLEVHRHDCAHILGRGRDGWHWIEVDWEAELHDALFDITLKVTAEGGRGVVNAVSQAIASADSVPVTLQLDRSSFPLQLIEVTVQVRDRQHLAQILRAVRVQPSVTRIERIQPQAGGRS